MTTRVIFVLVVIGMFSTRAMAEEPREVFEVEIDAGVDEIWEAFTTTKGLQSWVTPLADIDLKVGENGGQITIRMALWVMLQQL